MNRPSAVVYCSRSIRKLMKNTSPSVASDIYTVGRTLAVLMMEFRGYQSTYVKSLPPVDDTALVADADYTAALASGEALVFEPEPEEDEEEERRARARRAAEAAEEDGEDDPTLA